MAQTKSKGHTELSNEDAKYKTEIVTLADETALNSWVENIQGIFSATLYTFFNKIELKVDSFIGKCGVATLLFIVFVYQAVFCEGILESLDMTRKNSYPYLHSDYDSLMNDTNFKLACPQDWATCDVEYPLSFSQQVSTNILYKNPGQLKEMILNDNINGMSISLDWAMGFLTSINATTGLNSCDELGLLPVGKKRLGGRRYSRNN